MITILVWAVVILWCFAALFLVSLPVVFAVMFLVGKGDLASKWWARIKPRSRHVSDYSDTKHEFPDYMFDPIYKSSICNVYNDDKYRH